MQHLCVVVNFMIKSCFQGHEGERGQAGADGKPGATVSLPISYSFGLLVIADHC